MIETLFISFIMVWMYLMGGAVTWFLMRDRSPASETYWRNIISKDIENAINNGSEVNGYGAYLIAKNGTNNA
jgi:hypothetical protein